MKNILKNYKGTIILVAGLIIGAILGFIFGEDIVAIKPLGDLFINLLFVVIVPLIFLTVSTSIIKMDSPKRLGKIMSRILITFVIMSVISALVGIVATYSFELVNNNDSSSILSLLDDGVEIDTELSVLERTVSLLTVKDFTLLLSKDSIIALLVFTILFALAVRKSGDKAEPIKNILESLNDIVINLVNIISLYAPIGLGAYMAVLIGTYGDTIALGFLKTFVIYTIACAVLYFVGYSLYVFLAGGKKALKAYWSVILHPTATALATCSSAACIPINVKAAKDMGVSDDIAETTIPMGTSFHKDGSVIGSVFKIMFLVYLFEMSPSVWTVFVVSIIATLLVTALPIGGGTISEMFIITLMGFPPAALPILTIIATVIDAPATILNVVGDTAGSAIVGRLVDGKNWLKDKSNKVKETVKNTKKTKKEA